MIEIKDMDCVKKMELEVLLAIHRFCIDNNIEYFLACGSLIGAIRHNGFIPWDDDIDIYMKRKDFDFFVSHFENDEFGVNACETNKKYFWSYAKAFSKKCLKIENRLSNKLKQGVDVDIFILSDCHDVKYALSKNAHRKFIQFFWLIATLDKANAKGFKGKLALLFSPLLRPFCNYLARRTNYLLSKDKKTNDKCEYYQSFSVVSKRIHILRKEWFDKPVLHIFENYEFYIPNNYDAVLKEEYGDYMTMPAVSKQKTEHDYKVYIN